MFLFKFVLQLANFTFTNCSYVVLYYAALSHALHCALEYVSCAGQPAAKLPVGLFFAITFGFEYFILFPLLFVVELVCLPE